MLRIHVGRLLALCALTPASAFAQVLTAEIDASVALPGQILGSAAVAGERMLVSAWPVGGDPSVYVFERSSSGWAQVDELVPLVPTNGTGFGSSFDLDESGQRAIVGASYGGDGVVQTGAAYVFERTPNGWRQTAELFPSDGAWVPPYGFQFGCSVAISGDMALVGARMANVAGLEAGAVYWFVRTSTGWVERGRLSPRNPWPGQSFGRMVALDGDTAAVCAVDAPYSPQGNVHVFERAGVRWTEVAVLQPDDLELFDNFGGSLDLDGDRLLVGTPWDDTDLLLASGSAYVFERQSPGGWTQVAKLIASDGDSGDYFGGSVAIQGSIALIGASGVITGPSATGAAYVFYETSNGWAQASKLVDPTPPVYLRVGVHDFTGSRMVLGGIGFLYVYDFVPLVGDPDQVSTSLGGTHAFSLDAGPAYANLPYLILGTSSGMASPFTVDGVTVPLTLDAYTLLTLTSPNQPPLSLSFGLLDNLGRAGAGPALVVPAGAPAAWAGLTLDHAYVVIDPAVPGVVLASNAESVMLVP